MEYPLRNEKKSMKSYSGADSGVGSITALHLTVVSSPLLPFALHRLVVLSPYSSLSPFPLVGIGRRSTSHPSMLHFGQTLSVSSVSFPFLRLSHLAAMS